MATDTEIKAESYWKREQVGENLKAFGVRCCAHFGVGASAFGTVGNTAHLVGRHRSLEWNLYSKFATRRNYGTTDQRDVRGNHRLIRAFDLGLPRPALFEVSRNLEAACRDGSAYMLAEWYGDLGDDSVVDGWFEGRDSTSDNSHKTHAHGGLWTVYADDADALDDLFNIVIGADMAISQDDINKIVRQVINGLITESTDAGYVAGVPGDALNRAIAPAMDRTLGDLHRKVDAIATEVAAVKARPTATVDAPALAAGVVQGLLAAGIQPPTADAIAAAIGQREAAADRARADVLDE